MSREIKFRVIRGEKIVGYERLNKGEWEFMVPDLNPDTGERWVPGIIKLTYQPDELKRDQFTGRQEKSKNDVYENDIIECEYRSGLPTTEKLESLIWRGKVEYFPTHTHFSVMTKDGHSYSVGFSGSAVKRYEVIGNIHQDKHLLS